MGAGILPVCFKSGVMLLLLGKEGYEKKWSDFGGGKEKKEGEKYLRESKWKAAHEKKVSLDQMVYWYYNDVACHIPLFVKVGERR